MPNRIATPKAVRQRAMHVSPAQLGVLASSVRLAIVQRLDIDGPATARALAAFLGQPVTGLYHHLKQLRDKRVIRITEVRRGGRRPEAVYALVGKQLSSSRAARTAAGRESLRRVAARVLGATLRAFSASLSGAAARLEGPGRNAALRHLVFRADAARLAVVNSAIDELCAAASTTGEGERLLLTVVLAPLAVEKK